MELIDIFALFSCVLLVVCGLYYGAAFVRRKNYLLGVEFLIVGISATNFTTFIATGWQTNYDVCLLYTSPSPRDQRGSRMPSSA